MLAQPRHPLAEAARPADRVRPGSARPQVHDVAGADQPGARRASRRPGGRRRRWPSATPVSSLVRPGSTRTRWPSVAQRLAHLVGQVAPSRPRRRGAGAGRPALEHAVEERRPVDRLRRSAGLVQAGAPRFRRARASHVDPDPDHDRLEPARRRTRPRPGPRPASRPSTSRSLGHLRTGSTPATRRAGVRRRQGHGPGAEVEVSRRRTPGAAGPTPAGSLPGATPSAGRAGPARRVWCSATATRPSAAPWRAWSRT